MLNINQFLKSEYSTRLSNTEITDLRLLTKIFPFKVSRYVLEELIDWDNYGNDPIYHLIFPKKEMLKPKDWLRLEEAVRLNQERQVIYEIRKSLNPHPDGQKNNIPMLNGEAVGGIQHKYSETVLFFPAQGQTCHSYCTYCFRWAQFVNVDEHKFRSKERNTLLEYLKQHQEVTDVLFTGGDPMYMNNEQFFHYLSVFFHKELAHIKSIRIGTKSLAYQPQRFLGEEGDAFLAKLKELQQQGKHIALMAHFSHPNELATEKVQLAIKRIRAAGIQIRTQAPLIRGINDNSETWRFMWQRQVELGLVPYYMFIERDTGAHDYFSVPLSRAYKIFTDAYTNISGLAKTVRGPSMSTSPGKVLVEGIIEILDQKFFVLKFIQARDKSKMNKPFLARYDERVTWFDELEIFEKPLYGGFSSRMDETDQSLPQQDSVSVVDNVTV